MWAGPWANWSTEEAAPKQTVLAAVRSGCKVLLPPASDPLGRPVLVAFFSENQKGIRTALADVHWRPSVRRLLRALLWFSRPEGPSQAEQDQGAADELVVVDEVEGDVRERRPAGGQGHEASSSGRGPDAPPPGE